MAIAFAREGADVAISYLSEDEDAHEVQRVVEAANRKCLLLRGDPADPSRCRAIVARTLEEFGGLDVLVNNAAH